MKKTVILCFCLLLSAGGHVLAGSDGPAWSGLWKMVQETESGPVTLYLQLKSPEVKPTLYSHDWGELALSDWKLEGDKISVNWQAKGGNLVFRGTREGDRFTGGWEFLHPQYDLKGNFAAVRLFSDPAWTPLAGLDALNPGSNGFVDLNEILVKAVQGGDFVGFWKTEFQPKYYALIGDTPPPAEVERLVASPGFSQRAASFHEDVLEHLKRAKEKTARVGFAFPIVSFCFGDESRLVNVGSQAFLVANSEKLGGGLSDRPQVLTRSAEVLIGTTMRSLLPAGRGLHLEMFRAGVPLYLASQLDYSKNLGDILQVSASQAQSLESELGDLKKRVLSRESLKAEEKRFLAYDFTKTLGADQPVEKLVRMNPVAIGEAFKKYITQ